MFTQVWLTRMLPLIKCDRHITLLNFQSSHLELLGTFCIYSFLTLQSGDILIQFAFIIVCINRRTSAVYVSSGGKQISCMSFLSFMSEIVSYCCSKSFNYNLAHECECSLSFVTYLVNEKNYFLMQLIVNIKFEF